MGIGGTFYESQHESQTGIGGTFHAPFHESQMGIGGTFYESQHESQMGIGGTFRENGVEFCNPAGDCGKLRFFFRSDSKHKAIIFE